MFGQRGARKTVVTIGSDFCRTACIAKYVKQAAATVSLSDALITSAKSMKMQRRRKVRLPGEPRHSAPLTTAVKQQTTLRKLSGPSSATISFVPCYTHPTAMVSPSPASASCASSMPESCATLMFRCLALQGQARLAAPCGTWSSISHLISM